MKQEFWTWFYLTDFYSWNICDWENEPFAYLEIQFKKKLPIQNIIFLM